MGEEAQVAIAKQPAQWVNFNRKVTIVGVAVWALLLVSIVARESYWTVRYVLVQGTPEPKFLGAWDWLALLLGLSTVVGVAAWKSSRELIAKMKGGATT